MQTEIIEQIIHLTIYERVEIIEKLSRSVREEMRGKAAESSFEKEKELSIEERKAIVESLYGIAAVEGKTPPTDEEIRKKIENNIEQKNGKEVEETLIDEKKAAYLRLRGALKMENPPMTKEEVREVIYEHLSEKYK